MDFVFSVILYLIKISVASIVAYFVIKKAVSDAIKESK